MADYAFHPDALLEYADAASYYLREASPTVAERFVAAVESAMASILAAPDRWRVVEEPGIRPTCSAAFHTCFITVGMPRSSS
jgi:plasmid stabilization system protein ParE